VLQENRQFKTDVDHMWQHCFLVLTFILLHGFLQLFVKLLQSVFGQGDPPADGPPGRVLLLQLIPGIGG
jgi:hypothetical protein